MNRKMKNSGIKWIGLIPNEYKIVKVKNLFNIGRGRVISLLEIDDNGEYPVYSSQTKNNGCLGYINTYDFDCSQLTWTTDGANAGTVFLREGKHNCTNVCGTLLPKNNINNIRYLKYALEYIAIFHKRADTNGFKIMNNEMAEIKITLPPIEEQELIANYLDKRISRVEDIIRQTNISIKEYKKYKYALITKCVTKGINKSVDMKSTDVDWIGQIPKEWEYMKLKYIFSIKKDIAGKEGFDILSVTQSGLKIKDISKNEGQISADYSKYQIVEKGDFVMNHMDLLTGWVDCSKYYGVTSPDYRVFKFKNSELYSPEYYTYIMQICYKNKIFYGLGQGVSNLGRWRLQTDKFLNFMLPVPPKEEQEQIVNYLDNKCTEIDNIIEQKQKLLIEMEAYKKSLIYECVTGKREVK
ncbi:restriction endonuclease subunit S [Clostridium perfringens]|uniref:restriction endonuclease subunit S n=1 Tax=Clostridium perfringens TaxID=1502 RepID=UPI0018E4BFC5|nr:restriction endonuclease subunit S [Clostridium perfringens]MBI5994911.1 restriction endonuclease subunit S [Clostridium perfringens]MDM0700750.1 restriction endonuclease subunit S [Clostridium perfringens]